MSLIPSTWGALRSNIFDPFSLDVWDPWINLPFSTLTTSLVPGSKTAAETLPFANVRIDWRETPEAHIFRADIPGVKKDEVKVEVEDGNILRITGQLTREKEETTDTWHRLERSYGQFLRRFRLPDNAKVEQVKAKLDNGVLTVTVPKNQWPRKTLRLSLKTTSCKEPLLPLGCAVCSASDVSGLTISRLLTLSLSLSLLPPCFPVDSRVPIRKLRFSSEIIRFEQSCRVGVCDEVLVTAIGAAFCLCSSFHRRIIFIFSLLYFPTWDSPEDVKYYSTTSEVIKCKDGSKKINRNQLNDDFCDCPDGSDEPGSGMQGRQLAQMEGFTAGMQFKQIKHLCFSVDCCDGSDEYDGKIKCLNTCWEAGKVARDKLNKKIAAYQNGIKLRRKEIEQARLAVAKEEAELSKLRNEEKTLKDLVQKLKDHKEQIEKVEEKERLEKEKEENLRKEAEKESGQENKEAGEKLESDKESMSVQEMSSETEHAGGSDVEGSLPNAAELPAKENGEEHNVASDSGPDRRHEHETAEIEGIEGLSKEELGRLVASRWTGEKTDHDSGAAAYATNNNNGEKETVNPVHEDENYSYASDFDDNDHRYDANDVEEDEDDNLAGEDHGASSSHKSDSEDESSASNITAPKGESWHEKVRNRVKSLLQVMPFFRTPLNMSDAAGVRKEYDEFSTKLSDIQSRISTLSEKLKHDFGMSTKCAHIKRLPRRRDTEPHGWDFCCMALDSWNWTIEDVNPGKCRDVKILLLGSTFCGGMSEHDTSEDIRHWEKFEDGYKLMVFSNGDACWNGPDRSLKVKLRCGLKNEVTDIDEPSCCEYVALLSTPSVCLEEQLKELQQNLDALNTD